MVGANNSHFNMDRFCSNKVSLNPEYVAVRVFEIGSWARISKCVPKHIFLAKNLNFPNYIQFVIYWKPRQRSNWI